MAFLRMYRVSLGPDAPSRFGDFKAALGEFMKPLLQPAMAAPAAVLGVAPSSLLPVSRQARHEMFDRSVALDGEVFTDGPSLVVVALLDVERTSFQLRRRQVIPPTDAEQFRLDITLISNGHQAAHADQILKSAERILGAPASQFVFPNERFDELKSENRESPAEPTPEEILASQLLSDRNLRTLAVAIKASGGLLLRDVPKQLPQDVRDASETFVEQLKQAGLVGSEIVIVCSKTSAQVTRARDLNVLTALSEMGLKCACGRLLADERIEEALAITEVGRGLLDKSRWLTVLLLRELELLGIPTSSVLVEQTVGGDEIDCVANISGELALFELKDKEFSLGNAYSFGAKIGIIRPNHRVIVTTETVGNDAKEHFVRARIAGPNDDEYGTERRSELLYVEGVNALSARLRELVFAIYRTDAIARLNQVLPLGAMDGGALVRTVDVGPSA